MTPTRCAMSAVTGYTVSVASTSSTKALTAFALRFQLGPLHTMRQLSDSHHRDANLSLAIHLSDLCHDLCHSLPAPLSPDDDAGIENQSNKDGFQGFRLRTICSTSAANSTAELRYLVLPERPPGTDGMTEDQLAALVTRDAMVGVAKVSPPK